MPQLFRPYADTVARSILGGDSWWCAFLAIGLGLLVLGSDYVTGQTMTPGPAGAFSHQHHVGGLGLDCRYCHTGVETFRGRRRPADPHLHDLPFAALHQCRRCSRRCGRSLAEQRPIHWNKVNRLPDYVYFDHSIHIAKGVGCTTCHGDSRPHAADAAGGAADHGLVPRLPPRSGAQSAAGRAVFDPDWNRAGRSGGARARCWLANYHIDNRHLTDCSVCHR